MQQIAADVDRSEDLLHLLRLYRLMVFASTEQSEPLLVSDIVVDAVDLFKHHTTFRDLDVRVNPDTTIPPVLMSQAGLTQAVLLLLCTAARQVSLARGETGVLVVNFSADANSVLIAVNVDEAGAKSGGEEPPELPALRYLIRDVNGSAEITPVGTTLSIGTLVSLRQREKRG
jgi:nitrogen-specific signal transduction histidine kinase